jgi:hypothetical protein
VRERLADTVAPGRYQILAAISAVHTSARDVRDTDWSQVVALYDQLVRLDPSPIIALNRAIAVAELDGPEVALAAVDRLEPRMAGYHAYHAARADLGPRRLPPNPGLGPTRTVTPGPFSRPKGRGSAPWSSRPAALARHVPAALAQADLGRHLHRPLFFVGRVTTGRDHREDEPALPQTHSADQDRIIGIRQHDHVADVDVTGQDHVLHESGRYRPGRPASS